jgi:hypothetical protein
VKTPTAGRFTQLAGGFAFTCALRDDGRVQCWGDNSRGQAPALVVSPGAPYRKVVAGYQAACALREPHVADCWGRVSSRDLGVLQSLGAISGTAPAALAPGSTFEVAATASTGLPVHFEYQDPDPTSPDACTVSGTTVTAVSAGLCVVVAAQDGDAWWRRVTRRREIGLAFLTLGRLGQLYDGTPRPVTLAVAPSFVPVTLTYDGQSSPPTAPGRYAVVAAVDPAASLYATSRVTGTLVVEMPRIAVQPARVSLSASTLVTVYVYGSDIVDVAAITPVSVRLRVEGGGPGLAQVATRNGAYMTLVRDFDGDGKPDRQLVFLRSDLQAAGLTVGARTLVLSDHAGAYRFEARAATPLDVVP